MTSKHLVWTFALLCGAQLWACAPGESQLDPSAGAAGHGDVAVAEAALLSCRSSWSCYLRSRETPRCDRSTGTCVECLSDSHCRDAGDVCREGSCVAEEPESTAYVPCVDDSDCAAPTYCSTVGAGYCTPPCEYPDVSQCGDGVPAGSVMACFGDTCLVECDATSDCPSTLQCAGPGSYCMP